MLRKDTLQTIQTAIARGESVAPTPEAIRAVDAQARQLRAHALRKALTAVASLFRTRNLVVPVGAIDVVRGH
ncbi:hypothetical protein [Reyranella sp. CPCC 100927]|uniref:hypothetical protein n=1 Tax=Reyranella sp. CPCC 100927 TaxID=2599616 RepID=UPI0011B36FBE|nr:hypothetical protein [Reyranella sp. CPCC 100927]TWT15075.1 hypothetical protein FQU96_01530 [Reyranella sp. CPCC 100927]